MIKYILRRPLLPFLLLCILIFEICFAGSLRSGIEKDSMLVEDLYSTTKITAQIYPGLQSAGTLNFRIHAGDRIERLEEYESSCYSMQCPYTVREPICELGAGMLYGTNDVLWFAEKRKLEITFLDGYTPESLWNKQSGAPWSGLGEDIPCVAGSDFMEKFHFTIGDRFTAAPYDGLDIDNPNAPNGYMRIVGTFDNTELAVGKCGMIVPDDIFLDGPVFYFNWRIQGTYCTYREYEFCIKAEYNKEYDEIEAKITELLKDQDVTVHSDVRLMKKAIRPIEQRLQIQKALSAPVEIAFGVVTVVIALLLAISLQEEIFLRRLWGESRKKTFARLLLSMTAILLMAAAIACLIGLFVLGLSWLGWMTSYLAKIIVASVVMMALPTCIFCNKNLVNFYQTKEG